MAKRHTTLITDDLDGATLDDAVSMNFSIEGVAYELDLSSRNADALRAVLAPYIAVARTVSTGRGGSAARAHRPDAPDLSAVRAWARANGHEVSDRGRVSGTVLRAYKAAQ